MSEFDIDNIIKSQHSNHEDNSMNQSITQECLIRPTSIARKSLNFQKSPRKIKKEKNLSENFKVSVKESRKRPNFKLSQLKSSILLENRSKDLLESVFSIFSIFIMLVLFFI